MAKIPEVTILLPLYNAESYIGPAIKSVLLQTFKDFELLIINDGSTDNSKEIVQSFKDSRIRLVNNHKNLGLVATLNRGLELAQADLIARMDADDLCLPQRIEKQVEFLKAHPNIGVLGTDIYIIDSTDRVIGRPPPIHSDPYLINWVLLRTCCLYHPTIMMRKSIFEHSRSYNKNYKHCEDYELWLRLSNKVKFSIINQPLLYYRQHQNSISSSFSNHQLRLSAKAVQTFAQQRYQLHLPHKLARVLLNPRLASKLSTDQCKQLRDFYLAAFNKEITKKELKPIHKNLIRSTALRFMIILSLSTAKAQPMHLPIFVYGFLKALKFKWKTLHYLNLTLIMYFIRKTGIKEKLFHRKILI